MHTRIQETDQKYRTNDEHSVRKKILEVMNKNHLKSENQVKIYSNFPLFW